jgi:hypothetical protein
MLVADGLAVARIRCGGRGCAEWWIEVGDEAYFRQSWASIDNSKAM